MSTGAVEGAGFDGFHTAASLWQVRTCTGDGLGAGRARLSGWESGQCPPCIAGSFLAHPGLRASSHIALLVIWTDPSSTDWPTHPDSCRARGAGKGPVGVVVGGGGPEMRGAQCPLSGGGFCCASSLCPVVGHSQDAGMMGIQQFCTPGFEVLWGRGIGQCGASLLAH